MTVTFRLTYLTVQTMSDSTKTNNGRTTVTAPSDSPRGLAEWVEVLLEDIESAYQHDPAARNKLEIAALYPGLHAIWIHRAANLLQRKRRHTAARILSHINRFLTGVEIHPGATLGRRIFIDHGMGVVVGETAVIGDDCLIYKGVVLGGTTLERTDRHPKLGRGVVVGSNACVLGSIHIGDGALVGSGSVVIRDVPDASTVVGVPGRVVSDPIETRHAEALDHAQLPDPVLDLLRELTQQVDDLKTRLRSVEKADEESGQPEAEDDAEPEVEKEAEPAA